MRRSSVVLVLVALVLLAAGGLTLAGSSAATLSSRVIACPLMRGVIIPCCVPQTNGAMVPGRWTSRAVVPAPGPIGCCRPNAVCASTLTIASNPNPSTADRRVVISGQLLGATTVGMPVVLWQRLPGDSQFHRMLKTTTDAAGKYQISRRARQVQTDREWYAIAGTIRSVTITQAVAAIVTLEAAAGKRGSTIFAGRVSPSHPGERILLQRHGSRGWLTIARPRLTRASTFTVSHRLAKGTVELQAVLPADSENVRSVSAPLMLSSH